MYVYNVVQRYFKIIIIMQCTTKVESSGCRCIKIKYYIILNLSAHVLPFFKGWQGHFQKKGEKFKINLSLLGRIKRFHLS